jgi:hypothetical protein
MRYRIDETTVDGALTATSAEFVTLTVWLTLFIGLGFVIVGIKGQQRWLVACSSFAIAISLGLISS